MIFLYKKMGALRWYIVYIVEDSTDYALNKLWDSFFGGGVAGEWGRGRRLSTLLFGLILSETNLEKTIKVIY